MWTFLRVAGGLSYLVLLFLPSIYCCGETRSVFRWAAHADHFWAIVFFLASLALGAFAVLWPLCTKRIEEWEELLAMAGSAGSFAAIIWLMVDMSGRRVGILWTVGVLLLTTVLMFLGSMERYRRRKRWS